jgi:hypothetical protein
MPDSVPFLVPAGLDCSITCKSGSSYRLKLGKYVNVKLDDIGAFLLIGANRRLRARSENEACAACLVRSSRNGRSGV